jgi:hypothetical protein
MDRPNPEQHRATGCRSTRALLITRERCRVGLLGWHLPIPRADPESMDILRSFEGGRGSELAGDLPIKHQVRDS